MRNQKTQLNNYEMVLIVFDELPSMLPAIQPSNALSLTTKTKENTKENMKENKEQKSKLIFVIFSFYNI